jgi:hypothetical protein
MSTTTIPRTVTVNTDSRITLQSFKKKKNYIYLIEEIRKKAISTSEMQLENHIDLGKGSRRKIRERASGKVSEVSHQNWLDILQQNS